MRSTTLVSRTRQGAEAVLMISSAFASPPPPSHHDLLIRALLRETQQVPRPHDRPNDERDGRARAKPQALLYEACALGRPCEGHTRTSRIAQDLKVQQIARGNEGQLV